MTSAGLFAPRSDPYAGADFERSTRVGAALLLLSALCLGGLFALDPPTAAIGAAGWPLAGATVAVCLAGALRLVRSAEHVTWNGLYAASFGALGLIALLEWLARGPAPPHPPLFPLCGGSATPG